MKKIITITLIVTLILTLALGLSACSKKTEEEKEIEAQMDTIEKELKKEAKREEDKKEEIDIFRDIIRNDDIVLTMDNYKDYLDISEDRIVNYEDCYFEYSKFNNEILLKSLKPGVQLEENLIMPSAILEPGGRLFVVTHIDSSNILDEKIDFRNTIKHKINTLVLPEYLEIISSSAFEAVGLKGKLEIPSTVKEIRNKAFGQDKTAVDLGIIEVSPEYVNKIEELIIPSDSKLEKIGNYAFCNNLISNDLAFPNTIYSIGNGAFYGNSITRLEFAGGRDTSGMMGHKNKLGLGAEAFHKNKIKEVVVPSHLDIDLKALEYNGENSDSLPEIILIEN